jgi:hypothetical protein
VAEQSVVTDHRLAARQALYWPSVFDLHRYRWTRVRQVGLHGLKTHHVKHRPVLVYAVPAGRRHKHTRDARPNAASTAAPRRTGYCHHPRPQDSGHHRTPAPGRTAAASCVQRPPLCWWTPRRRPQPQAQAMQDRTPRQQQRETDLLLPSQPSAPAATDNQPPARRPTRPLAALRSTATARWVDVGVAGRLHKQQAHDAGLTVPSTGAPRQSWLLAPPAAEHPVVACHQLPTAGSTRDPDPTSGLHVPPLYRRERPSRRAPSPAADLTTQRRTSCRSAAPRCTGY